MKNRLKITKTHVGIVVMVLSVLLGAHSVLNAVFESTDFSYLVPMIPIALVTTLSIRLLLIIEKEDSKNERI